MNNFETKKTGVKKESIPLPLDAPKIGEIYRHFKSEDKYQVVDLVLDASTDTWSVIYEPLYDNEIKRFVRPIADWQSKKMHEGTEVERFTLVEKE